MYKRYSHYRKSFSPRQQRVKTVDVSLLVRKSTQDITDMPQPIQNQFADFLISDQLRRNIAQKGYTKPTPIQDKVIPLALQGKDIVGIANTGTGKTAAFLIPLINKILYNRTQRVLIVAPTRELAVQTQQEANAFTKNMNIFSLLCIGGVGIYKQIQGLKKNPNIVIGTPGRLKDLIQQGKLPIVSFNNIVLDEVDRMTDMGFIADIKFLITKLPSKRQSLFFSATIPPQTTSIIQTLLKSPVTISVKTRETVATVEQSIVKINGRNKTEVLRNMLSQSDFRKVLVFGRTKWGINRLSTTLMQQGLKVAAIHGNKSQIQRQRALDQFKNGRINVLLATDLASRGLDIDDISHVINYDQPASYEDYIHRIGRTGRANKKGVALTFVE